MRYDVTVMRVLSRVQRPVVKDEEEVAVVVVVDEPGDLL
jgi:hypothetical protein